MGLINYKCGYAYAIWFVVLAQGLDVFRTESIATDG
jgi:hypothetical protein